MNFSKAFLLVFAFGMFNVQLQASVPFRDFLNSGNPSSQCHDKGFAHEKIPGLSKSVGLVDNGKSSKKREVGDPGLENQGNRESIELNYYFPRQILTGSSFLFKCKINKGAIKGPVWLSQQLPLHFEIAEPMIANAETDYNGNSLNLVWDNIANDSIIEIGYRVFVNQSYGYLPISTVLYFAETGEEYFFDTHVLIDKVRPKKEPTTPDLPKGDPCLAFVPLTDLTSGEAMTNLDNQNTRAIDDFYSIQILALKCNCTNPKLLKDKFNIDKEVFVEESQNWTIYTIGKFQTVKEVSLYLRKIRKKGLTDAFIVGFRENGGGMAAMFRNK
jgi:hypothetical protein